MERIFYIDQIKSEDINKLTIRLNEMQEVSHIKIMKDSISFNCARPDNVQTFLDESDLDYVLKEIVNKKKREYVSSETKIEQFFMFENLENEEDANEIREILSKYSVYENINLDFQNKMLTLTTSHRNVLKRISRIVRNVNPNIHVEQWKKPFKSQDIFNEKYIQKYIRIAILFVGFAIGLVTRNDTTFLTYFGYLIALMVCSEEIIRNAIKDIRLKQFVSEHIIILLACLGGWAYRAFIEAILVAILYQVGQFVISKVSHSTMVKIDNLVNKERLGRRLRHQQEEMIPLTDFDIGDIVIVNEGESIPLGGKIIKGQAKLDVYAIDGSDVLVDSQIGQEVYSGTVVNEGNVQIKTTALYEDSAMNTVLNIAMNAPINKSKTEEIIEKVSLGYTLALILVGILCCTVAPLLHLSENMKSVYLGVIMLTMAGSSVYKQGASYSLIAGVAKALTKKIAIKENSGLDDLNTCVTIIYDRFDGIETTDEEMDLFEKLSKIHKSLIIFNDGPTDLENDQYLIYNNLTVEEKLDIMDKAMIAGPVAYIGDCDKDVALLQKASVGISRGGVHNDKVIRNSDIMLADSNYDTIIDLFNITRKQKSINIQNTFIGIFVSLLVVLLAVISIMPWWLAIVIYYLETILVLLNTQRITYM